MPEKLCRATCDKAKIYMDKHKRTSTCVDPICKADEHRIGALLEDIGRKNKAGGGNRGSGSGGCPSTRQALRLAMEIQLLPRTATREGTDDIVNSLAKAARLGSSDKGQLKTLAEKGADTVSSSLRTVIAKMKEVVDCGCRHVKPSRKICREDDLESWNVEHEVVEKGCMPRTGVRNCTTGDEKRESADRLSTLHKTLDLQRGGNG